MEQIIKFGRNCDLECELHDGGGAIDVDGRGLGAAGLTRWLPVKIYEIKSFL
jgi:hypothetical protein